MIGRTLYISLLLFVALQAEGSHKSLIMHFDRSFQTKCNQDNVDSLALFNEKIQGHVVVVKFSAGWCGPCHIYAPIFETVAQQNPVLENIRIQYITVDIDAFPDIASQFQINSFPVTIIYKRGKQQTVLRGCQDEITLKNKIHEVANSLLG